MKAFFIWFPLLFYFIVFHIEEKKVHIDSQNHRNPPNRGGLGTFYDLNVHKTKKKTVGIGLICKLSCF